MIKKTLNDYLSDYKSSHRALPAFNIDTFEIYQAVEAAVAETHLPCIVQLSSGEDNFIEAERLLLLVKKARLQGLPIYTNMDHGKDVKRLLSLVGLGFDMVHLDASKLAYSDCLALTQAFVASAKSQNPDILIESEFNHINLVGTAIDSSSFTDPSQAFEFVGTTKTDLLAISIGNLHGVSTTAPETIDQSRLDQIAATLPETTFLTLHGGSGISSSQIKAAIKSGIVKININTDLRLKFKLSLADNLSRISSEKIYDYFTPVVADLKNLVIQKLIHFSQT